MDRHPLLGHQTSKAVRYKLGDMYPPIPTEVIALSPITVEDAKAYFEKHTAFRGDFTAAIAAKRGDVIHGIIAFHMDGKVSEKRQIWTDGTPQVGTLLYGAWVRASMGHGYKGVQFGE